MKIQQTILATADRPLTSLVLIMAAFSLGFLAPAIDNSIPVLSKAETSTVVFIGDREVGWKLDVCRWRPGPKWDGASFVVTPRDGSPSYTLFNVMDLDAGVEVGSGSISYKAGECRTLRYAAVLPERIREGDTISGIAKYRSFFWGITNLYGTFVVPPFPKLLEYQQRIIQRELENQGQGISELVK